MVAVQVVVFDWLESQWVHDLAKLPNNNIRPRNAMFLFADVEHGLLRHYESWRVEPLDNLTVQKLRFNGSMQINVQLQIRRISIYNV